ncbi:DUF6922 domain-containing protein [Mucilaginibacter psychrotolerans]|jgi:hypothetical protein|uniref:DUF6922 domain-containing protein n=1 Tax=Mucilaginibacter psychrotolerans TaxID=1524096 RepID=A0A4Y8SKY8_9SPHI|nr:hypothetical protein [Mucilaginibacter psychrotolerans]TFF39114.1 hypothetical protein E2R66_05670 [Mucilaginibacter psychrotolerans]
MNKPVLSKQAFWDVDMDKIDYEKHALYVMEKVINRGSLEDIISVKKFYGDDKIKKEIVNASWLGDKEIYFCCAIFNLEPADFKCYIKKQLNPQLWLS